MVIQKLDYNQQSHVAGCYLCSISSTHQMLGKTSEEMLNAEVDRMAGAGRYQQKVVSCWDQNWEANICC